MAMDEIFFVFREVVLGEWRIHSNPDCTTSLYGRRTCSPRKITRKVRNFIIHENFDRRKLKNDIALLRLDQAVPLFEENPDISGASPICLPWDIDNFARDLIKGDNVIVTGWGRVSNDLDQHVRNVRRQRAGSNILKKVKLPVLDRNVCRGEWGLNTRKQICAGSMRG